MKNLPLAAWLEHCEEIVCQLDDPAPLAIFEGVMSVAATGQLTMLESVLDGAARNALALNQPASVVLWQIEVTKLTILGRVELEIEPVAMWEFLPAAELIFQQATALAVDSYTTALQESYQRQAAEAARLSQEAAQKVMTHAAELARANRELARLEQAKTDFISIAAHELKTPLTVLQGYIDILLENETLAELFDGNMLNGIRGGTMRLTDIVDNLLDVSAIETNSLILHLASVSVSNLIDVAARRAQPVLTDRDLRLELNVDADLPLITTDHQRLYQVIDQLLGNAIKYTPNGGSIAIMATLTPSRHHDLTMMKITVKDTGIGIAPEDIERIFDKFYRIGDTDNHSSGKTKFKGAGPGLGLSIVKGIVESLHGAISVYSPGYDEVNCPGATFHVRLPLDLNIE